MHSSVVITETGKGLEKLSNIAYLSLRDSIVSLELLPGALLSENSLGQSMGLSRTPIREALKRLEREYLVAILPRRGIIVTDVDLRSQLQILEIRRGIESRLIIRGTERATDEQQEEFMRLADKMEVCAENKDLPGYIALDSQFDIQIELAAGNRFLTDAMQPVHALVRRFWYTQKRTKELQAALNQHAQMVRSAATGDAEQVRALLTEMYDSSEKYILSLLS